MCGLIAQFGKSEVFNTRIGEGMLKALRHRGPDDLSYVNYQNIAWLGHVRLSILDKKNSNQPMHSKCGRYALIFNGEIYNYIELREELKCLNVSFCTNGDTEVLLQLLIADGSEAISKLNGMFAFVFYDKETNCWLAARDHFGIKPLYYASIGLNDELLFGSEIKSLLLHPTINSACNYQSLSQYLSFQFCLDERTLFDSIVKIKPGHYLKGKGPIVLENECYWDLNYQVDNLHAEDYFQAELLRLLEDSIKLQIRSDVPLGAYLSGGIDSSLICKLASDYLGKAIPMFHGKFSEGPEYDESEYAKSLADSINGIVLNVNPTSQQFVQVLPQLIEALDEPVAGPGVFPQYILSKLAREHVTVVLGGQGGDEIFGGYARYLAGYLEQALKGAILETQEEGKHLVTLESIIPNLALLKQYTPLLSNFWSKGLFDDMDARYFHLINRSHGINHLLHPDLVASFDKDQLFADFQCVFNRPDTKSYINKMTHFDQKTLLPALLQVEDRVSMSVSLESRVPLLDRRIVDLVASMPPALKFQGGRTKHILKKTTCNLLPESILKRKDKMGFPVPLQEWMQAGVVRDFVGDTLLSQSSRQRGIYRPEALEAMLNCPGVGGRQLWGALSLEIWHQRFIDAA